MSDLTELLRPTPLDPHMLERDLQRHLRAATNLDGKPLSRACTLNLLLCVPVASQIESLSAMLREQAMNHPNRTIALAVEPHAPAASLEVTGQVYAADRGGGQRRQMVYEQLSIVAKGSASGQITSMVLSLLVPDLPVVLWWPGRAPFQEPLFGRLEGLVDRVLVDSAEFAAPEHDLLTLADSADRRYAISDLNWARLTPWRELTAQFFDARPLLPHLRRLDKVAIGYEQAVGSVPNRNQALLLAGWLTAQLGWVPLEGGVSVEGERIQLHLRRPAVGVGKSAIRLVTIELYPTPPREDALAGLAALTLQATDGVRASFTVSRAEDPNVARTAVDVAELPAMERIAKLDHLTQSDLIGEELRMTGQDRTYQAALQMAGRFAHGMV